MDMEKTRRIKAAIIEVVNNQIASNDPPETKETLERLVGEGFSEQQSKELIGNVVVAELFDVMQDGKTFDRERYVDALNRLPEKPF